MNNKYSFNYSYFTTGDGNGMSIQERIQEALALLTKNGDYIEFEDGRKCQNKEELISILREKGILID
jgi:hypothetical protein